MLAPEVIGSAAIVTSPAMVFCPCGASLVTYEDDHCPGATPVIHATYERFLESLLGRRRLLLIERMGKVPFIRIWLCRTRSGRGRTVTHW